MNLKKILITGGAGFIGFNLAKKYFDLGYEVYLIDNLSRGKIDTDLKNFLKKKKIKFKNIDLSSQKIKINENFNLIFHCAAIIGVKHVSSKPYDVLIKNIKMLENVIDFSKKQKKLERFIFFSTSEVYAETLKKKLIKFPTPEESLILVDQKFSSRSTYMLSKIYGEYICNFSNLPVTIVRPHNFYGPRMGLSHVIPELTKKIFFKNKVKIISHNHKRTFYFIDDAIQEIFQLVQSKKSLGKIYNVGSGKEITIYNLAKLISKQLDKKVELIRSPDIHSSPSRRQPRVSKIKNVTKYNSKNLIEIGLKKTISWYLKNYFNNKKNIKII